MTLVAWLGLLCSRLQIYGGDWSFYIVTLPATGSWEIDRSTKDRAFQYSHVQILQAMGKGWWLDRCPGS